MENAMNFDYPPGASPAEIWAILREVAEGRKEDRLRMQETERVMKENDERRQKEWEQRQKEWEQRQKEWEKTERIVRRNSKQMGDLHRRFGQLAEHLVAPNIHKRFNELGYHFGAAGPAA